MSETRLIDANALKEIIETYRLDKCFNDLQRGKDRMIDCCIAEINNAPTIVEERPKGEWIDHSEDGYVECPICEHLTTCEDNIDELHYCWNCGADMRKGGAV